MKQKTVLIIFVIVISILLGFTIYAHIVAR